jgi:2-polyprenyl-3-methyl-5-hydroxy-6-metoxy-1,4-benzoquinol methylase
MDLDAKAATWDDDPQKVERARRVAEAILAQVSGTERMSVLEYGCGTGLLGLALRPHVARVTMADSSPGMLQVVRRKIEASGLEGMAPLRLDLAVDPPPAGRWDLVCTLMTLHHVRDVDALLRSFHAVLAPRGIVCIADLDREDGSFHGPGVEVHRGFDRDDLAARLARAGFGGARFTTAFEMQKAAGGAARTYPVFLAVAERA